TLFGNSARIRSMSYKSSERRVAPATGAAAETALTPQTPKAAAATLPQAFAAALGVRPPPGHPGDLLRKDAANRRPPAGEPSALRMKNTRPGAPAAPRKGHR